MPIQRFSKLVALAAVLCCGTAAAQTFSARPVKILVPSVAGSSPDIRAVIVENRTGANGLIAAFARSETEKWGRLGREAGIKAQ